MGTNRVLQTTTVAPDGKDEDRRPDDDRCNREDELRGLQPMSVERECADNNDPRHRNE